MFIDFECLNVNWLILKLAPYTCSESTRTYLELIGSQLVFSYASTPTTDEFTKTSQIPSMFRTKLKTSISNINIGTKTNTMNHIHLVGAPNVWMESMVLLVLVLVLILWPFIPYVSKRLDLKVGGDEFSKGLMIIVDHV